jgi:hypothetical protein
MDKTVAARLSKHDREIDAIRKLIRMGMRLLVNTDQQLNRLAGEHDLFQRQLRQQAAAGRETDRRLNALIRALERGGNGRGPSAH